MKFNTLDIIVALIFLIKSFGCKTNFKCTTRKPRTAWSADHSVRVIAKRLLFLLSSCGAILKFQNCSDRTAPHGPKLWHVDP